MIIIISRRATALNIRMINLRHGISYLHIEAIS